MIPSTREARLPVLALVLAGCATGPASPTADTAQRFYANDLEGALRLSTSLAAQGPFRDRTVHLLEAGQIQLSTGRVQAALTCFGEASAHMGLLHGEGQEAARTLMGQESDKEFKGEPYEQCFCCFFEGLAHLASGNPSRAKVSFLASKLNDVGTDPRSTFALAVFFEGLCRKLLGEDEAARQRLSWVEQLVPESRPLVEQVLTGRWNTVLLVGCGRGPAKVRSGAGGASLSFRQEFSPVVGVRVRSGAAQAEAVRLGWAFHQASKRGGRVADRLNGDDARLKEMQQQVGQELFMESGHLLLSAPAPGPQCSQAGVTAAVGTVFLISSALIRAGADVRHWATLPDGFYVALLDLPSGKAELHIEGLGTDGQAVGNHVQTWTDVPVGDRSVLYVRLFPGRIGGRWPCAQDSTQRPESEKKP